MSGNKLRVAVKISGGASTFQAMLRAQKSGRLSYVQFVCLVTSNDLPDKGGKGVHRAQVEGMRPEDCLIIRPKDFSSREQAGEEELRQYRRRGVDFVSLNGYIPLTAENVVAEYLRRSANQHPGPVRPGKLDFGGKGMYGRRVHAARMNFVKETKRSPWTEATYQFLHQELDRGDVFKRARVDIELNDTVEILQERVLPVEYEVVISGLEDFSQNRAQVETLDDDLVRPGEEEILAWAKNKAIEDWPNG